VRKTIFLSTIALLSVAFYSARSASAQSPAQTPAPTDKAAGEVYKNVQVLKDIPASDLDNTMWFIAGSLGVPCQHCHVNPNDSDVKQSKLTARKMIQMTRDLNAANFGGKPVVTCNTCHQGSLKPNGVPNFYGKDNKSPEQLAAYMKERQPAGPPGQAAAPAPSVSPTPAPAPPENLPSVETIFDNYHKAVGVTAVTSIHMVADVDPDLGPPGQIEISAVFPDKIEQTFTGMGIHTRQIANGDQGWLVGPNATIPAAPAQVKALKGIISNFSPYKFSVADVPRKVSGIEKIGDHSYYVVEWQNGNRRSRLYFDTQSGLLYKSHGEAITPLGTYPYETIYSDYREVNGVKIPAMTTTLGSSGGQRFKFTKIEINVPIDAKRFDPPTQPATPAQPPKQ